MAILHETVDTIGNISIDCVYARDSIIRIGGLKDLIQLLDQIVDETLIVNCCRTISIFCRGDRLPIHNHVKSAIFALCRAIANDKLSDKKVLAGCCLAIYQHSNAIETVTAVMDNGLVPNIIKQLQKENDAKLVLPCIAILGKIFQEAKEHIDLLLAYRILGELKKLLDHHMMKVRKDVCLFIARIADGNQQHVRTLLERESLVKVLLHLFDTDENQVKRNTCFIFYDLKYYGDKQQILSLYKATKIAQYYLNIL